MSAEPNFPEGVFYTTSGEPPPGYTPDEEPVRLPLVIYVGDERKIVGDALVTGNTIEAHFDPVKNRDSEVVVSELSRLITHGVIQNVSVAFNAPPAVPVLDGNGHVRWKKDY